MLQRRKAAKPAISAAIRTFHCHCPESLSERDSFERFGGRVGKATRITIARRRPFPYKSHDWRARAPLRLHALADHLSNVRFRQLMNNADDLSGNFRVQRGGRFIKQRLRRSIISAQRAIATRCC